MHFLLDEFYQFLCELIKNVEPITPTSEIEKLCPIISGLYLKMKIIVDQISDVNSMLTEISEDINENEDIPYLECSLVLGFKCLHQILTYSPLYLPTNRNLFVKILRSFCGESSSKSLSDLRNKIFEDYLKKFSGNDLSVDCEISLVQILRLIVEDTQPQLKSKLSQLISRVLTMSISKVRFFFNL